MQTTQNKVNRVAIYARVSTQEQAEHGYSIDAQLKILYEYCKQSNKLPYKEYVDSGISGKSVDARPRLKQMMTDARNGLFDEVIVWKINRLSRKQNDLMNLVDELSKYNVTFRSYSENFETETPMGRFALQMMGSVAELERNTIVDNVKMGMKQRAQEGNWNGGIVLGYKSVDISTGSRKNRETHLEIIPEESMIVQRIFNLYANGKGLKAITNQLNHEGYKTKKGNPFNVNGIKDILHNPIYIGKIRFGRNPNYSTIGRSTSNDYIIVDGKQEAIISIELWGKVHCLYKAKSGKPPKTFEGTFPLTGLIRCPVCGAGMVSHRTKKKNKDGTYTIHKYYTCGQWRNKGTAVCKSNGIRADYAENYIFHRLQEILCNRQILQDIVDNINEKRQNIVKPLNEELIIINRKINECDRKNTKYFDLYMENIITKEVLSKKLEGLETEKESSIQRKSHIESELDSQTTDYIPYEFVEHILNNFENSLRTAPIENQKSLLQLIIKDISVTNDKKIDKINLKFDEDIQRYFLKDKAGESSTMGDSSCISKYNQKSYPLFVVRFTTYYSKPSVNLLQ
ncbi:recombinase family protein [Clostridium sp.]|uniref:recombinase family protein n=1 Tax=Clostridium sp. TaxID=1506 RepID=UPI003D6D9716